MQVETYHSNDYAGLNSVGYEIEDEPTSDRCFQVKENGKVIFQRTQSEIEKPIKVDLDNPQGYLLAGIGMWLLFYKD